jgi:hypothetical protein
MQRFSSFRKRLKHLFKKNRLKLYTPESREAKFLTREIEATKAVLHVMEVQTCYVERRFTTYCQWAWDHANEFVIPGVLFLYITGWIGLDENMYVTQVQKNPFENEIIINVPVAIGIMNSGLMACGSLKELTSGDLLASDDDVTVSHDNRILFSKLKYSSKLIYERLFKILLNSTCFNYSLDVDYFCFYYLY